MKSQGFCSTCCTVSETFWKSNPKDFRRPSADGKDPMHSSPRGAGNLAQKSCILQNSNVGLYCDSVLPDVVSLHLTSQILLR